MKRKDTDLIFLLSENARSRLVDLARMTGKSSQRLKYQRDTLIRKGTLYGPHVVIDYSFFGLILFRVYFIGAYVSERERDTILRRFRDAGWVVAAYELSGQYDLAIEIQAPNPSRFNKELKQLIADMPRLGTYKVIVNMVTHHYPRSYLSRRTEQVPDMVIGGDREVESFSKHELALLRSLLQGPLRPKTVLARKSGMHVSTFNSLLASLQKRRVLRGFRMLLNAEELVIQRFRLLLKLHNVTEEREHALGLYCRDSRQAISFSKTIGDWDAEIDIEAFDRTAIRRFTTRLRDEFKDIIEAFNLVEFHQAYFRSYLPEAYFGENP